MEQPNYKINNIQKNHLSQRSKKPFSTGADDLKKYLFVNVKNHNLPKTAVFFDENDMSDILAYIIVRSEYATTMNPELFAEAFCFMTCYKWKQTS